MAHSHWVYSSTLVGDTDASQNDHKIVADKCPTGCLVLRYNLQWGYATSALGRDKGPPELYPKTYRYTAGKRAPRDPTNIQKEDVYI